MDAILAELGTDPSAGLTSDEASARLARDGKNELPPPKRPSALKRLFDQFANPIVLTLLVAAVIAVAHGSAGRGEEPFLVRYGDAFAIFLIVGLNAVLGYYQETRAEAALDALATRCSWSRRPSSSRAIFSSSRRATRSPRTRAYSTRSTLPRRRRP
jgi:Ca2+-transporting ATPase